MAIIALIFQLNAHVQLNIIYRLINTCYMFRRSLSHPQREFLSFFKCSVYFMLDTMADLGLAVA